MEVVAIWIGFCDGEIVRESCVHSGTENTSAVGWTYKSSFSDASQENHACVSHRLASLVLDRNFCVCSQNFAEWMNVVMDLLSRDFHLSDDLLTDLLKFF